MKVYVEGIGLCGPGLAGWMAGSTILAGREAYSLAPILIPPAELLPAAERRRMVQTVKLALAVGCEALAHAQRAADQTATIFTSSGSDGETIHAILDVLASPQKEISPTRFHNSVHNAPSGYWNIAVHSRAPSTSLCGYDVSFAVGLLDAAAQAVVDNREVLLVAYDLPYAGPLHAIRPLHAAFGAALVLTPQATTRSLACIDIAHGHYRLPVTPMTDSALETLRVGNPAARSLPILAAIAYGAPQQIVLNGVGSNQLVLAMTPTRDLPA